MGRRNCLLIGLLACAGCGDVALPPEGSECEPVPGDSIRVAWQYEASCSRENQLAYVDDGIICKCADGALVSDPNLGGVYILDLTQGHSQRVLPWARGPCWSPAGDRLMVTLRGLHAVTLADLHVERITPVGDYYNPAWSPSGEWIAYEHSSSVWVARSDGSDPRDVGRVSGSEAFSPSWSIDGSLLLHIRPVNDAYGREIFTMRADGTALHRLTHNQLDDDSPTYSPDGRRIAFSGRNRDGLEEVWLMNADGSNVKRLTTRWAAFPTWTPDSAHLVYSRPGTVCGGRDSGVLWKLDIETGLESQLTYPWTQRCDPCAAE